MKITLNLKFPENLKPQEFDLIITKALNKKRHIVHKIRYTYIETEKGIADMPAALMACLLMCEKNAMGGGFGWYMPNFNGKYILDFQT